MSHDRRAGAATRPWRCEMSGFTVVPRWTLDRKSTRLNSSHDQISYAVFCLKKKKKKKDHTSQLQQRKLSVCRLLLRITRKQPVNQSALMSHTKISPVGHHSILASVTTTQVQ